MKSNFFEQCLKQNKISEFSRGKALVLKELELAQFDFERGSRTFGDDDYKWATIQAYYSMFHSARALLYEKNYREKSHACLIEAVRVFYVEENKLGYWLIEAMQEAKRLREDADYYGEFSKDMAESMLSKASEFLEKSKEILENKDY